MALRAFIQSIEFTSDAEAHLVGVVTDDVRKVEIDLRVSSMDELRQRLGQTLQHVKTTDDLRSLKVNDVIDLSSAPPTKDELDRQLFLEAYMAYLSGFRKIQCGLLPADDTDVAALKKSALDSYHAIYAGVG